MRSAVSLPPASGDKTGGVCS